MDAVNQKVDKLHTEMMVALYKIVTREDFQLDNHVKTYILGETNIDKIISSEEKFIKVIWDGKDTNLLLKLLINRFTPIDDCGVISPLCSEHADPNRIVVRELS